MPDTAARRRGRLGVSVREFFQIPLTEDPLERRLSGQVSGVLWMGGGFVSLGPRLIGRGGPFHLPLWLVVAVSIGALVCGALSLWVIDWVNGPAWTSHATAATGLVVLSALVYLTGSDSSVGWEYFSWLALYGCFFFRRNAAIGFALACLVAQGLPLAFHLGQAENDEDLWRFALVVFGYASVGLAMINGKGLLAELRRRAEREADTDPLTGLGNHRRMDRALSEHAARIMRDGGYFSLAVLDVDHLRRIAERSGSDGADLAVRDLASALGALAGPHDVLARTGGDEFTWLMPGMTAAQARYRVETARVRLIGTAPESRVQFSAGLSDSSVEIDPPALTRLAEGALYWAKIQGRNQSQVYDPAEMDVLSAQERAERLALNQALVGLQALARAIDAKDPATREHSERVAALAQQLALNAGWDDAGARWLHEAALVHDVGKIGIDDAVLRKADALTPEERAHVNSHAEISARIVEGVLCPEQVGWIRTHHERVDGSGYPQGLTGDEIPMGGALLAVADAYDAMTAGRRYSAPRPPLDALAECRAQVGRHFHPQAVAALEQYLRGLGDLTPGARPVPAG